MLGDYGKNLVDGENTFIFVLSFTKKIIPMINQQIAEGITQYFIDALKLGRIPWQKPWKAVSENGTFLMSGESWNIASKKHYNGINSLILDSLCLTVPVFGTFNQWNKLDCLLKKGSKGIMIVYWSILYKDGDKNITQDEYLAMSKERQKKVAKIPFLKYDKVFDYGQLEKISDKVKKTIENKYPVQPETETIETPAAPKFEGVENESIKMILANWGADLRHSSKNRAYYSPTLDYIHMPNPELFINRREYYQTLMHEGIHWTGHKSRFNRFDKENSEPDVKGLEYNCEELVAEIGSCMLLSQLGIELNMINSAAYINGWIEALQANPKWIIESASKAVKAAEFILKTGKIDVEQA